MEIKITEYEASKGRSFHRVVDKENDALFGFVRLRFPSQFLRSEITENPFNQGNRFSCRSDGKQKIQLHKALENAMQKAENCKAKLRTRLS